MAVSYPAMNNALNGEGEVLVDLRSDTVTRPSAEMYEAINSAPVGDDVYGDDETVNRLESKTAAMLGKEAAIFVSSGTQSNLVAMMTHCQRGEEVITGDQYHVSVAEARGASVLGGISMHTLQTDDNGGLHPDQVKAAIKPDNIHCPVSRLLCLENTVSGQVQTPEKIQVLCEAGRQGGLSLHLDGARLMNAAVDLNISATQLAAPFDSISLCLSKGLGAPVGSVLCGAQDFIHRARRIRKLLGGGMRQAGILAACGLYALEKNIDRLAHDHDNARLLADGLSVIGHLEVSQQTNMVFIEMAEDRATELKQYLAERGIVASVEFPSTRLVTHLDVSRRQVERVVEAITDFYQ